jgi:hypothetical protein
MRRSLRGRAPLRDLRCLGKIFCMRSQSESGRRYFSKLPAPSMVSSFCRVPFSETQLAKGLAYFSRPIIFRIGSLVKNSFQSRKVSILVEEVCSEISPIQCVVKPSSFVSTRWSWQSTFLQREQYLIRTDMITQSKRPAPLGFSEFYDIQST